MPFVRLDKFLSNSGIGTRSEVRKYIKFKRIWVNGEPALSPSVKIDIENSVVTFDKRVVSYEKYVYLMLNKPKGFISATKDENEKTVLDLIPEEYDKYNLFPVGRLDKDTVGLLILSNDGRFAHNTLSPRKHVEKTYFVRVNSNVEQKHIGLFKKGIVIDKTYKCLPANMEIVNTSHEFSEVIVTIKEGKYHQIKKMFLAIGMEVTYLKRLSFGEIYLDKTLKEGEFRTLNEQEMKIILEFTKK